MVKPIDLERTYRLLYLVLEQYQGADAWNPKFEQSPLDRGRLDKLHQRLEMIQLQSEINGQVVNLYA